MTSICWKKISTEVRLIHAHQMSLYNLIILRKQWTQMKAKQLKQGLLNQYESLGFPKLYCRFSCAENWELVKLIVETKFRRSHDCLHSHIFKHSQIF